MIARSRADIIGLVQLKGGAGRSTLATNIAGELARASNVLLVDADMPQGTAASWAAYRQERLGEDMDLAATHVADYKALAELVEAQQHAFDYIVLDGPPRIADLVAVILALSDLALIPVGASAAETWATADMLESIGDAQRENPGLEVRTVWTRYRGYTRSAGEISKAANKDFGLKPMRTKIGFRVAYPDALEKGLTVTEGRWPEAASEIQSLTREIRRLLK